MNIALWLVKISRPRFWGYLLGPYALGVAAAARSVNHANSAWLLAVFAVFFTLPANLLLYGVNDMFDYETDKLNPKKQGYEVLVEPKNHVQVARHIVVLCAPFILLLGTLGVAFFAKLCVLLFLVLCLAYSVPPVRLKARPFADMLCNVLYVAPGLVGYALATGGRAPGAPIIVAAALWCMAMHAYSAVPDIASDRQSGTNTVATRLGAGKTIVACAVLYGLAAVSSYEVLGWLAVVLAAVYSVVLWRSYLVREKEELLRIYKWFPLINMVCGAVLYLSIATKKL